MFSLEYFFILLSPVGFPLNYILAFLVPSVFALFWLRLQLERALNWWKSIQEPLLWDVEKSVEEYANLLEEQRKKKETRNRQRSER